MLSGKWVWAGFLAVALTSAVACGQQEDVEAAIHEVSTLPEVMPGEKALVLVYGADVLPAVQARTTLLLQKASTNRPVRSAKANAPLPSLPSEALVLSFGDTVAAQGTIDRAALAKLGPEGYVLRSGNSSGGAPILATAGNAPTDDILKHGNLGTAFGTYALLEELGFSFLHPLAPTSPTTVTAPTSSVDRAEAPRWHERGMHLHTMHPLELTDLLEGIGPNGPNDEAGWQAQLPEWDRFLEWMLANKQNRVEWVLLSAKSWEQFADSSTRQARFKTLADHAHAYGLAAGADAPIALQQQHTWRLVRKQGDLADEKKQIRDRLDWLLDAGFDFFSTESGSTEFTHPDPARMVAWMDEAALHAKKRGVPSYIKIHCSTGQEAEGFIDPKTGKPINFNMLPHFAKPELGIMPHTVQMYGLKDPAPTYGNTNFGYMREFLQEEVGRRHVVWHPETAYWVTFDINVPLFLPIYAERRVSDLRLLASDEDAGRMGRGEHAGKHMDGQMIFSSGWEWGYWLNDVVAARAAWNPHMEAGSDREALTKVLEPVTKALGADAPKWIADTAAEQARLLIRGEVNGRVPADIKQRNGMAYLEGFDAMADIATLGGALGIEASPITQPAKLGLVDMRNPLHGGPGYSAEIEPLLADMELSFGRLSQRGAALASSAPATAKDLASDLAAASKMTALRAQQVHGLYGYVDGWPFGDMNGRLQRLGRARTALDEATRVVADREKHYRVPADRIAGYHDGPTAYEFGYLWTVRSLYFWWRDEGKAVDAPASPCYLNIMSPADIALGEGIVADTAAAIRRALGAGAISACLSAPQQAPRFPQDGLRTRP